MEAMIRFVDAYRDDHGVEPVCNVLQIAPSTYHEHARRRQQPDTAPARVRRDGELCAHLCHRSASRSLDCLCPLPFDAN